MSVVYNILFITGKIFSFILVLFAFGISVLILFKPNLALSLNRRFNALYSTRGLSEALDQNFSVSEKLLSHRFKLGTGFIAGSAFVLWYLLFQFDPDQFIQYVVQPVSPTALMGIQWVLKVFVGLIVFGSFLGLLSGLMIVTTPEKFRRLSHTMDHWVSTQPAMDALEKSHSTVDEWVIKHHIAVGLFLFLGSIFLVFACTQTFLR